MLLRAYCIYDCKGLIYHNPFFAPTDGIAVRIVTDVATDLQTSVGKHPKDYSLWFCGTWDDSSGLFTAHHPLVHVVDCQALLPSQGALPLVDEPQPTHLRKVL